MMKQSIYNNITMRSLPAVILMIMAALLTGPAEASGVVEADDDSYYNEVVRSELPVVLEFYADWCGYCKKVAPEVDKLASRLSGSVKVVRINVDKAPTTTSRFKVRPIPAFFYLEDGNVRGETVGAMSADELLEELGVPE